MSAHSHIITFRHMGDPSGRPGYLFSFHYAPETVEALKAAVPHTDRAWDPKKKVWWVAEGYESELEALFRNFHALAFDQMRMF